MGKPKGNFTANFKAKIACEALKENKTISELASENKVHTQQIARWKKQLLEESPKVFENKNNKEKNESKDLAELQRIIGDQAIQLAWYKKKLGIFN